MANLLNVHRSTISKYETGEIIPNYQTLLQFAQIYKVDKSFLINELDESQRNETGSDTYILKEGPIDHDLDLIKQLLQGYPELKKSLLELYNFDEKTKAQTIKVVQFLIQGMKQK